MILDKRSELREAKPSRSKDRTWFLYKNETEKTEGVSDKQKPTSESRSWGLQSFARSAILLTVYYLAMYNTQCVGAATIPDSSGSALSTRMRPEPTSRLMQGNGTNLTSDVAPSPTSDLSPALSHQLKTLGIGDLSHEATKPLAPSSDKHGHQEETSAIDTIDAKPSKQEFRKTKKVSEVSRDLPPAELCQEALNNQPLVERVLNDTDFIGQVLNNTNLMQRVLANKEFVQAVLGNQTFVENTLANTEFVNNALNNREFVNNALNNKFWANWGINKTTRYGSIAAIGVAAVIGAAVAVAIEQFIRH